MKVKVDSKPELLVIDNFYEDPDLVRNDALRAQKVKSEYWKGRRSKALGAAILEPIKKRMEELLGIKVEKEFRSHFHIHEAEEARVFHYDLQRWAAVIYLCKDAPLTGGTAFYKHREIKEFTHGIDEAMIAKSGKSNNELYRAYNEGILDRTKWDQVDSVGNVYNRCIVFNAQRLHAVMNYFGRDDENRRLVQLFFFE